MQKLFDWNNYCFKVNIKMQKRNKMKHTNGEEKSLALKLNVCQSDILFADITSIFYYEINLNFMNIY